MKRLCAIALLTLSISFAFGNPVITSLPPSGNWKINATWNLNRAPADGDTVIIPAGKTVIIDNVQDLSGSSLYIEVRGTLEFSGGKLWLNTNSVVIVYPGGSVTGTGSSSETLRINGVNKYWGHVDGTILGPATASINTGTAPSGFNFGSIIPLPVKYLGFSVTCENNDVLVEWATAEEVNASYYQVQRSENGTNWHTIGSIKAEGNSMLTHTYSYTDKNVSPQVVYYRICQVDIDGKFAFTPVRMVKKENSNLEISATAGSGSIYLHFSGQIKGNVMLRLTSLSGQVVSQRILIEPVGQVVVPVQKTLKEIYVITIMDGQGLKFSKQVLL